MTRVRADFGNREIETPPKPAVGAVAGILQGQSGYSASPSRRQAQRDAESGGPEGPGLQAFGHGHAFTRVGGLQALDGVHVEQDRGRRLGELQRGVDQVREVRRQAGDAEALPVQRDPLQALPAPLPLVVEIGEEIRKRGLGWRKAPGRRAGSRAPARRSAGRAARSDRRLRPRWRWPARVQRRCGEQPGYGEAHRAVNGPCGHFQATSPQLEHTTGLRRDFQGVSARGGRGARRCRLPFLRRCRLLFPARAQANDHTRHRLACRHGRKQRREHGLRYDQGHDAACLFE